MTTQYFAGDLFDNTHDAWAFAHDCKCEGSKGAGIARTLNLASCCPGMLSVAVRWDRTRGNGSDENWVSTFVADHHFRSMVLPCAPLTPHRRASRFHDTLGNSAG